MLRIDQNSIVFRAKERVFTVLFLSAFAFALTLHLIGFFLFDIRPIAFTPSNAQLPPIRVTADSKGWIPAFALAKVDEEKIEIPSYLLSKEPEPQIAYHPLSPFPLAEVATPFAGTIEIPLPLPPNGNPAKQVSIRALGPLADSLVIPDGIQLHLPSEENHWVFEFGLDNGKILWMKPLSPSPPQSLWSLADSLSFTDTGSSKGILVVEVSEK